MGPGSCEAIPRTRGDPISASQPSYATQCLAAKSSGADSAIILESQNGEAKITVADQGPGIDAEQISRIFERFWRGDTARRRDGRVGSGLGLAIARENAMLIGAIIGVSSEPGVGTRFEVVLPSAGGES